MCYPISMPVPDAQSPHYRHDDDPIWMQKIIAWLCENKHALDPYDRMLLAFNRIGDQVQADYTIKSIKL